jgi:hypothetical protein
MEKSNHSLEDQKTGCPDFEQAERYMQMARECHESGDQTMSRAAMKMVMMCLGYENDQGRERFR